ncbi:hypothetical protein ABH15_10055 [Methanoculleus taiwanensis]|uniref:Uncharacterized protein n=1 Tax=Methanoculleus taiwanensis TaxID=1550565 RepID=A0A498H1F0_9EURY|nr:hypothetical protein [Methanoculleus taiwanensis]RXE56418.1 hypothetical protein ABH15_10055 [Methanoculleus taiwanensis]
MIVLHDFSAFWGRTAAGSDVFYSWKIETRRDRFGLPMVYIGYYLYGFGKDGITPLLYESGETISAESVGVNRLNTLNDVVAGKTGNFERRVRVAASDMGHTAVPGRLHTEEEIVRSMLADLLGSRLAEFERRLAAMEGSMAACHGSKEEESDGSQYIEA